MIKKKQTKQRKKKVAPDESLLMQINQKRFSLSKKRNKSISLRQVAKEIGIAHSTFFSVLYGDTKTGTAKAKIMKWLSSLDLYA